MSIINSVVTQITLNGDGTVRIREEHTFDTGEKRNFRYNSPLGEDYDFVIAASNKFDDRNYEHCQKNVCKICTYLTGISWS